MATVELNKSLNPDEAAKTLRDAMKGMGTNEKDIIKVVANCNNAQRQQILQRYNAAYGRDLIADLKSELGGSFEDAIVAVMQTPSVYDAQSLRASMKGAGTDESTIIEILATRSNAEINEIKNAYHNTFHRDLESDLKSETSGSFAHLMTSLIKGARYETTTVDQAKAQADAKALYDAGAGAWGTDESEFNRIFMSNSSAQIKAICDAYQAQTKTDLVTAVTKEMSGSLEQAYTTLIEAARNPAQYFAERIHAAIAGAGTDEAALIRVIISRSEKDLLHVAAAFKQKYQKDLKSAVEGEVGGDLKRLLVALLQ